MASRFERHRRHTAAPPSKSWAVSAAWIIHVAHDLLRAVSAVISSSQSITFALLPRFSIKLVSAGRGYTCLSQATRKASSLPKRSLNMIASSRGHGGF
jgi:hypothetical protein